VFHQIPSFTFYHAIEFNLQSTNSVLFSFLKKGAVLDIVDSPPGILRLGLGRAGLAQTRNATRDPSPGLRTVESGPSRGRGRDDPGGDACLGPPKPGSPPDALTTETSARRGRLGTRIHGGLSLDPSGIEGGQPFSSTVRFLWRDRGLGASEDRCRRRFCIARRLRRGDRSGGQWTMVAAPSGQDAGLQHVQRVCNIAPGRPGLLAKTTPVRDPWRFCTSSN
jgi:hypothetical protein